MRARFLSIFAALCALVAPGCAYPHPGPSLADDAQPAGLMPGDSVKAAPKKETATVEKTKPAAKKDVPTPAEPAPEKTKWVAKKDKAMASGRTSAAVSAAPVEKLEQPEIGSTMPRKKAMARTSAPVTDAAYSAPIMIDAPSHPKADAPVATPNGAPQVRANDDTSSDFDNVELVDPELKGKLAIVRAGSQPTPNNLLSIFAGLKNKTSSRLEIEVQTIYKDKAGNALNQGSWIPMVLKPREEKEYHSAAISEDATDFTVRIRSAPKTD